jgi:hypothetical protein
MARSTRHWLYFLGIVAVCFVVTFSLEAQCARCCQPPSQMGGWDCCQTFYSAGNGCEHDLRAGTCKELGSCEGDAGDCGRCVQEIWACGRPLEEEWRLERYAVEFPGTRPAVLAAKERKGKA